LNSPENLQCWQIAQSFLHIHILARVYTRSFSYANSFTPTLGVPDSKDGAADEDVTVVG